VNRIRNRLIFQPHFAVAAIAAAVATLAEVILAGILGAVDTNAGRFRFADAAGKGCRCHFEFVFLADVEERGGGCPASCERQR
jgi:hypothetical protein